MIEPAVIAALPLRAEEAWQPVLLGGMIPFLGAAAVFALIYKAVKANPENDSKDDEPPEAPVETEDSEDPSAPT